MKRKNNWENVTMIRKLSIKNETKSVNEMYDDLLKSLEDKPKEEKEKEVEIFNDVFGHDMQVEDELKYGTHEDRQRDKSYGR